MSDGRNTKIGMAIAKWLLLRVKDRVLGWWERRQERKRREAEDRIRLEKIRAAKAESKALDQEL